MGLLDMFPGDIRQVVPGGEEAARIGVFICHCGHNIAGYLDIAVLLESAGRLPNVVVAQDSMFACSDAGLVAIREAVDRHRLNRVVVASCTPRTHEPLFQATCEEAGLNRYLFEFVNIRDQCSWVHMDDKERATSKARDLIRMGAAKAALLEPLDEARLPVLPGALVIGGGIAGMTAALSLARRGFPVTLVENGPELGGLLRNLDTLYPSLVDARTLADDCIAEIIRNPQVDIMTSAMVVNVRGHIGAYEITVHSQQLGLDLPIQAGVIVVATGAAELKPAGLYGYGTDPCVLTQGELENLLAARSKRDAGGSCSPADPPAQQPQRAEADALSELRPKTVVMIQCAGARDETRSYCGRTCCLTAMKNAMRLKEQDPATEVHVLYRDIEVHGTHFEDYYAQARGMGVVFSRYTPDDPPLVTQGTVFLTDELLGARLRIRYDLLVLSTPMVPHQSSRELAKMLKVPVDEHGFFLEAHVKLRPLDFATDGIYLCGSAHWPAHLDEAISQAYGAAARATTVLSKDQIRSSGVIAKVSAYLCRGCERCLSVCEFGAIEIVCDEQDKPPFSLLGKVDTLPNKAIVQVNPVLCKGCGACAVICPTGAMQASHFTSRQVTAMIRAALEG